MILSSNDCSLDHATQVMIDATGIDAQALEEWSFLVEFAAKSLGLKVTVDEFKGIPPDGQSDFAYITASDALSRKVFMNFPLIYIQPQSSPFKVDSYFYWNLLKEEKKTKGWQPVTHLVTLISSVFRGDEFLEGFLDNCKSMLGYVNYEHFLIRPGSTGNEHEALISHVCEFPSSIYLNLEVDPGLYEVWNLGWKLSTARYISNANIDDRRSPDHLTHLVEVLDSNPSITAASTALRISKTRNLEWEDSGSCEVWFGDVGNLSIGGEGLFEERAGKFVSRNFLHCMPLWRRSIHANMGGFDEKRYGPSADWAFWVHAGIQGALFYLSAQPLGLYLYDKESYWRRDLSKRQNDKRIIEEFKSWFNSRGNKIWRPFSTSKEVSDCIELLDRGAIYEGLGKLLRVQRQGNRTGDVEIAILSRVAYQFFSCKDLSILFRCFENTLNVGLSFDIAIANVLISLVNSTKLNSQKARRTLALACVDLSECGGDLRGIFLQGLLAYKEDELAYEQLLRKHLINCDSALFYRTLLGFQWKLPCEVKLE